MWHRRFHALTTVVDVESACERSAATLGTLFATFPATSDVPDVRYRVAVDGGRRRLTRDGAIVDEAASAVDVPLIVERDLYRLAVERARNWIVLHAAAVSRANTTVVLAGPSGAGKTTLTRALLERGWSYLSEECVAIAADGTVVGFARPIHLEGAPAEVPSGFEHAQYTWSDASGRPTVTHLLLPPATAIAASARNDTQLFSIAHAPGSAGERAVLATNEALPRLWDCVLNDAPSTVTRVARLLERHAVVSVVSGTPERSCQLITQDP